MSDYEPIPTNREDLLRKIVTDMYYGNGKPGLTTRVLMMEKTLDSIERIGRWILAGIGLILLTALMNLILKK